MTPTASLVEFPAEQGARLEGAARAGVVLDFALTDCDSSETPDRVHEAALTEALRHFSEIRGVQVPSSPIPAGVRMTADEFYGWMYFRETHRLLVRATPRVMGEIQRRREADGGTRLGFGPYCWADLEDADHAVYLNDDHDDDRPNVIHRRDLPFGFAPAFTSPPHSLWVVDPGAPRGREPMRGSEILTLFRGVVDEVLASPGEDTEVYWWEGGEWAEYFDEGLVWWGAQAWTIRTDPRHIVVIGASASD